jgi:hypothetical protein
VVLPSFEGTRDKTCPLRVMGLVRTEGRGDPRGWRHSAGTRKSGGDASVYNNKNINHVQSIKFLGINN